MNELNKYFKSETIEIWRSEIIPAPYNPRTISVEARKALKQSIKRFGIVGGLVWNRTTSFLVSGHQKLSILDELNKYDGSKQADYRVKVEVISVDEKTEKELNIFFNNPNTQGEWDYDMLREMIPDIDYKFAGLTQEDLNLIGVDFNFQTDDERDIADAFEKVVAPIAERTAAVKQMKKEIRDKAEQKAENMDAYVMLSFDTYKSKTAFMRRFGFASDEKFIKGEVFSDMVERIE